jgi:hypothetical protein
MVSKKKLTARVSFQREVLSLGEFFENNLDICLRTGTVDLPIRSTNIENE